MRTLKRNKQKMYYALYTGEEPIYELDEIGNRIVDYVDGDGNVFYRETGTYQPSYTSPVAFRGCISMSSGESTIAEFGVDISAYDAVLIVEKDEIPVTETSLIWFETNPEDGMADYKVAAIKPSLNHLKIILSRVLK